MPFDGSKDISSSEPRPVSGKSLIANHVSILNPACDSNGVTISSRMVPGDRRHHPPQRAWTWSLAVLPHLRRNQPRTSLPRPAPGGVGLHFDMMSWHLRHRRE